MHHFKAMGESKLELQSGNSQFGWKSVIFLSCVTFKFDGWPWKLIGHIFFTSSSFVHRSIAISGVTAPKSSIRVKNRRFFVPCDLDIWRMTLKTRGHLFYAAASFVHHFDAMGEFKLELQSGNTQFGSKSAIFLAMWPWNSTDDIEKQ